MTDLGTLGGTTSYARAINSPGPVVGPSVTSKATKTPCCGSAPLRLIGDLEQRLEVLEGLLRLARNQVIRASWCWR